MFSLKNYRAEGLLLVAAMIWGFAFVAQRSTVTLIGPFAYSGVRFALGSLALLPVLLFFKRKNRNQARLGTRSPAASDHPVHPRMSRGRKLLWVVLAGLVLAVGANLQQIGLIYTTAANAGFVTCFYVVLVPLAGIFVGRSTGWRVWLGAVLALLGLYILSVGSGFTMSPGDLLELVGAFVWAAHILLINRLVSRIDALEIAVGQFATCAVLSLVAALLIEPAPFAGVAAATIPLLYGGLLSIGVAFTLQIVAQKTAHPAPAAIIMSMEALFAGIGGVLILGEALTPRLVVGGLAMLAGMIIAQLPPAMPAGSKAAGPLEIPQAD